MMVMTDRLIDLGRATPPFADAQRDALQAALGRVASRSDIEKVIRSNRIGGNDRDCDLAAHWLSKRLGYVAPRDRIIVANGTQNLLWLVLRQIVGRGGCIVAEELTHPLLPPIAAELDISVLPVPIDEEGLDPVNLDRICRIHRPRLIYCNPTGHNPTAAVMSEGRRRAISDVARALEIPILEDDVLGALRQPEPKPVAAYAPDITWYIQSLSKSIALGFRVAYLVTPESHDRSVFLNPMGMRSSWFASAIAIEVADELMASDQITPLTTSMADVSSRREGIARHIFGAYRVSTAQGALHCWLPLPEPGDADRFTALAKDAGVLIRTGRMFRANPQISPDAGGSAVRIALTATETEDELRAGLEILAQLYQSQYGMASV